MSGKVVHGPWAQLSDLKEMQEVIRAHRAFVALVVEKQLSHRELARIFSGFSKDNSVTEADVRQLMRNGRKPLPAFAKKWVKDNGGR